MNSMVSNRWLYCRCKPVEMSSDVPITSKWEDTCWVKYHSSSPCIKQGKGSPFLVCGGDPLKSLHRHDPPYDSGINSKPACWGGVELTLTWVVSFWPFIVMCHYRIDPHLGDTDINPHTNNIAMSALSHEKLIFFLVYSTHVLPMLSPYSLSNVSLRMGQLDAIKHDQVRRRITWVWCTLIVYGLPTTKFFKTSWQWQIKVEVHQGGIRPTSIEPASTRIKEKKVVIDKQNISPSSSSKLLINLYDH